MGIEQKGHEKSRPPGLGPEDTDKQPLAEHQSKDAARRRRDDEQHQLSYSPIHHRAGRLPGEDCQPEEGCQGRKIGSLATFPKEEELQDLV
jgi:hypothetical protein